MFNKKKKHFKQMKEDMQLLIWEQEFTRYKALEQREEKRQEFDAQKSAIQLYKDKYKKEKKAGNLSKDELARIDDQKVVAEKKVVDLGEELHKLDGDIYGLKPSEVLPMGKNGIEQKITALHELCETLEVYISKL